MATMIFTEVVGHILFYFLIFHHTVVPSLLLSCWIHLDHPNRVSRIMAKTNTQLILIPWLSLGRSQDWVCTAEGFSGMSSAESSSPLSSWKKYCSCYSPDNQHALLRMAALQMVCCGIHKIFIGHKWKTNCSLGASDEKSCPPNTGESWF